MIVSLITLGVAVIVMALLWRLAALMTELAALLRFLVLGSDVPLPSAQGGNIRRMDLTQRSPLLILVAVVLFIVAFLIAVGAIDGNAPAFGYAGLASFAAAHLP